MNGRSTATNGGSQRTSRNLAQIRKAQLHDAGHHSSDNVLASLRATQIVASKPVLPAELIATILDFCPIPDLMRFARVSRRLQEMVYDDTRWTQKLKAIGVWNEHEARQRVEEAMRRKAEAQRAREVEQARRTGVNLPGSGIGVAGGVGRRHAGSVTLFDAGVEEERQRKSLDKLRSPTLKRKGTLADGFEELTISPSSSSSAGGKAWDPSIALDIFKTLRSIRGRARHEFARLHSDAIIFRTYRDPEQQAQILANLKRFAQCDFATGWQQRESRLDNMIDVFENAVLREFEQGYAADDIDGRMHRYAYVLVTINGGAAVIETFISSHPIISHALRAGNPLDCLEAVAPGHIDLAPSQNFFEKLSSIMLEQAKIIDRVFPTTLDVLTPFFTRLCKETIDPYLTALFDEAHSKTGVETYLKAVSGTFTQSLHFLASLRPSTASPPNFVTEIAKQMIVQCYEKHIDLYLAEELSFFRSSSELEVSEWEKRQSEQEASTESFFMAGVNGNRQAAKRDFLSSFRKVVMMPVSVLPAFPLSSPFGGAKITNGAASSSTATVLEATAPSRSRTPTLTGASGTPVARPGTPAQEAPTTELAAKAAIMNSRLEGIRSLFSIEVALNLTHLAKASIERAANMVRMGGKHGEAAKEQCEAVFVTLLHVLGEKHVRRGFDKAVGHLSSYNPRQVREMRSKSANADDYTVQPVGVEPLVTFLELVNVGDLIQQMIEVFYAQELVATRLIDRDDFLDPAVKEKKRFEQMLDERVAAGLNKGIDVLMDEVEYLCASTQQATDFNPGSLDTAKDPKHPHHHNNSGVSDIGPTPTAHQIVATLRSHTTMLLGSTDKTILDVFTQEVGLRLFGALCKHIKRQRISVEGSVRLISDINLYSDFVGSLRQKPLGPYFRALRELGQIYLVRIDAPAASYFGGGVKKGSRMAAKGASSTTMAMQAKELAVIIADTRRYGGVFTVEEVLGFAERRADWFAVRGEVERGMYGVGCLVM
ncbi:F-box protein: endocytic membrane traffic, recycling ReCYcling 1 [Friedmanniomyces endolithicus]|uniref:F-box protein: endocytic membrane traffic, recycling ReCYcling 1 n=1 Tax=Friedmanniomyces endolithicus TaxID=329885 RepID=A0AAN6QN21_9PEZI|nr:F-box protein: endocytic membrane traffic, recycling ReCYcling 1 [Friedmanniomyces endolithicus]